MAEAMTSGQVDQEAEEARALDLRIGPREDRDGNAPTVTEDGGIDATRSLKFVSQDGTLGKFPAIVD